MQACFLSFSYSLSTIPVNKRSIKAAAEQEVFCQVPKPFTKIIKLQISFFLVSGQANPIFDNCQIPQSTDNFI